MLLVAVIIAIVAGLGSLGISAHPRHFEWLTSSLADVISPAPPVPSHMPKIGGLYPDAGWLPFSKGPFVESVESVYGPHPLAVCRIPGGYKGSCLAVNSDGIIANLWGKDPTNFNTMQMTLGGTSDYLKRYARQDTTVTSFFQSTAADPLYSVLLCVTYPKACDTGKMHVPVGAVPEPSTDHHLYIRDTDTHQDWSIWVAPIPTGKGGDYRPQGTANVLRVDQTTDGLGIGGAAGNISLAWSERPQDVLVGRIPHALSLRVTCDTTEDGIHGTYVYPVVPGTTSHVATDQQFFCGYPSANTDDEQQYVTNSASNVNLEYGAHLWLDVTPDRSQRGTPACDIIAYAELRALHEFGGYVADIGSAKWFEAPIYVNRMADINDTYDGNPNGITSYWAQVAGQIGKSTRPGATWHYKVQHCGIDLARHLHVLVPPSRD